jgi:anti-sigma-K factor RskA
MTAHDWFVEHRTDFVIRALAPDEERAFLEHLPGCIECRGAVELTERELAWLPMGASPVRPRPGLTRRLAEAALGRPRAPRRWITPVSLAASLLLAVGAWGWATRTVSQASAEQAADRGRLLRELANVRDTLEIIRSAAKVRHASIAMGKEHGGLVIFADDRTHRWNVVVYGLSAPPPGEVCQFWFITDSGMVRSVEVKSNGSGPAFMTLPMPPRGGTVMGAALSMEPAGGTSDKPAGTVLAHLMM